MSRKILMLLGLCVAGCVVAIVKAQEAATPPRSTLDPGGLSSGSAGRPSSRRRSVLADRLRTARENVTSDYKPRPLDNPAPVSAGVRNSLPSGTPRRGGSFRPVEKSQDSTTESPTPPVTPDPTRTSRGTTFSAGDSTKLPSVLSGPTATFESRQTVPAAGSDSSRRTARLPREEGFRSVSRTGSDNVMLSSRVPSLRVNTTGPGAVSIGKEATYAVVVANLGDSAARNITVSVEVPSWVEIAGSDSTQGNVSQPQQGAPRVIWTMDSVMPRAQQKLSLRVVPRESRAFDVAVDWAFRPEVKTARVDVQVPELKLTLAGPRDLVFGETEVYQLVLANPGTGPVENVQLRLSPNLGGQTVAVGTIAAGAQKKLDAKLTAQQAGQVEVRAEATGDGNLRAEASQRVAVRRAALDVAIVGPDFKYSGSTGTYELKLVNTGDASADDVVAAIAIPKGAQYIGGIERGQVIDGGVRWNVGKLAAGAERTYNVTCLLSTAGENRFEVGARATGDVTGADSIVTVVEALADLKLTVNDPRGPKPTGQEVVYEIKVANRGTKAATSVNVVAQFSKGIEPTSAEGARAELVPGQVIFDPIGRIEAGSEVSIKVRAKAETAGNHVFRFEIKCNDPESHCVSEGTTRFFGDEAPRTSKLPSPGQLNRRPAPAAPIQVR